MLTTIYLLIIKAYQLIIEVLAYLDHTKAKTRTRGLKAWKKKLPPHTLLAQKKVLWFHCASLGEFEQGRPLIELYKTNNPDYYIVLTFFSPSGYEIRKNYPFADYIAYLPYDTINNAKYWINYFRPSYTFFIKYEFWLNYLQSLKSINCKTFLISAYFPPKHKIYNLFYKKFYKKIFSLFYYIYAQDRSTVIHLTHYFALKNVVYAGDTRYDRVLSHAQSGFKHDIVTLFVGERVCLVAGSTWPPDEKLILIATEALSAKYPELCWIIAPHNVDQKHLSKLQRLLGNAGILLSECESSKHFESKKFLIVDNIGMLSKLYRYGRAAYIGGGFGRGIHNCLEAAVYQIPVVFGPNYQRFLEANELLTLNAAFSVSTAQELCRFLETKILSSPQTPYLLEVKAKLATFFEEKSGATERIFNHINELSNQK